MNEKLVTLIFVDDEDLQLRLASEYFREEVQREEMKMMTFERPQDCLKYLKEHRDEYSIIFSDINMPKMDGFEFITEINQLKVDTDIFLVSAYDGDSYKIRADSLGAKGYLTKPINFKAIKSLIKSYSNLKAS